MWTTSGISILNNIKKSILKKKILFNFMIDNYSKYDKIFKYFHIGIAVSIPVLSMINKIIETSTDSTSTATLIFGSIVAAMIKLKDYLKFDKIKDTAKQQTIKYEQLYQRIEREMIKPIDKRQSEEEFIYWVNREFNNIEVLDPDISRTIKEKYMQFCKDNKVPFDDDLDMLKELMIVRMTDDSTGITDNVGHRCSDEIKTTETINTTELKTNMTKSKTKNQVTGALEATMAEAKNTAESKNTAEVNSVSLSFIDSTADEDEKKEYKNKIVVLDTGKDMKWIMERFSTM
jgi:hypothetical protein